MNFADRLAKAIEEKQNPTVVGLDPTLKNIPGIFHLPEHEFDDGKDPRKIITDFNFAVIDAVADIVPAVKPNLAFYERIGAGGYSAFWETVRYAKKKGLIVIADGKRNDIGSTAEAYAEAYLGCDEIDALTVDASYIGSDCVKPFLKYAPEKGIFVLVRTSNPSAREFQDLPVGLHPLYYHVGACVAEWGKPFVGDSGYSSVGAVVGATHPTDAKVLRDLMPQTFFLVPGYGAQGGGAQDVAPCFIEGKGAIVNSSRGIIYAYKNPDKHFAEAIRDAALAMKDDLRRALKLG